MSDTPSTQRTLGGHCGSLAQASTGFMLAHSLVVFWQVHDALMGQYKIRIGEETFHCGEGAFAYLPSGVPHAFLNTTDDPGEIIVVYTPGRGHKFYEELGPLTRNGTPDRVAVAAVFEKYDMTLLGPPITDD